MDAARYTVRVPVTLSALVRYLADFSAPEPADAIGYRLMVRVSADAWDAPDSIEPGEKDHWPECRVVPAMDAELVLVYPLKRKRPADEA